MSSRQAALRVFSKKGPIAHLVRFRCITRPCHHVFPIPILSGGGCLASFLHRTSYALCIPSFRAQAPAPARSLCDEATRCQVHRGKIVVDRRLKTGRGNRKICKTVSHQNASKSFQNDPIKRFLARSNLNLPGIVPLLLSPRAHCTLLQ